MWKISFTPQHKVCFHSANLHKMPTLQLPVKNSCTNFTKIQWMV